MPRTVSNALSRMPPECSFEHMAGHMADMLSPDLLSPPYPALSTNVRRLEAATAKLPTLGGNTVSVCAISVKRQRMRPDTRHNLRLPLPRPLRRPRSSTARSAASTR
jgi:hypothetical protein